MNSTRRQRTKSRGSNAVVIFVTAASKQEADRIGLALVRAELAACVNIVPGIRSIFRWEGKVSRAREVLVIIKSRAVLVDRVVAEVKRHHSYQVPEIIACSITGGSDDYLEWIWQSTRKPLK